MFSPALIPRVRPERRSGSLGMCGLVHTCKSSCCRQSSFARGNAVRDSVFFDAPALPVAQDPDLSSVTIVMEEKPQTDLDPHIDQCPCCVCTAKSCSSAFALEEAWMTLLVEDFSHAAFKAFESRLKDAEQRLMSCKARLRRILKGAKAPSDASRLSPLASQYFFRAAFHAAMSESTSERKREAILAKVDKVRSLLRRQRFRVHPLV